MNTQLQLQDNIAQVILVLKAGQAFYLHLRSQIRDRDVQEVIQKMLDEHSVAIKELQTFVNPNTPNPNAELLAQSIISTYQQLTEVISFACLHVYVDQLEELENKTLIVIDGAIATPQAQFSKQYLQRVRVSVQDCHDQIKLL